MAQLRKLKYRPTQSTYSKEASASETVRVQLDGGQGRHRRDITRVSRFVQCRWIVNKSGYDYLSAFERVFSKNAEPFLINLIVEESALVECKAWFMPGTFKLSEQRGNGYYCTAQLEVVTPLYDPQLDEDLLDLNDAFGEDWPYWCDRLDIIVNVKLPEAMPA